MESTQKLEGQFKLIQVHLDMLDQKSLLTEIDRLAKDEKNN